MNEEMVILSRTFDLLAWLLPKAERFPRVYRHTVTARLMNSALDFQECLFSAQLQRGQKRYATLCDGDAYLHRIRLYLRLAHHWHWLSHGQHEHISRVFAELGRLLGGWIKQTERSQHNK